jgi:hypothetical protein
MWNKFLMASLLALGTSSISNLSTAQSTLPPSDGVSKDLWLAAMHPMIPTAVCQAFFSERALKKFFDLNKITYERCVAVIPKIATDCQNKFYAQIPQSINNGSAKVWGCKIGECIGENFTNQYLFPKH